jgi:hypothetical protein
MFSWKILWKLLAMTAAVGVAPDDNLEAAAAHRVLRHDLLEVFEEPGAEDLPGVAERAGRPGDHQVGVHAVVQRLPGVRKIAAIKLRS